jgi:hypothetical protein
MKRALAGFLVALAATAAVGCGSGSKTDTEEGIAAPGALSPRSPTEVRVREAEEARKEREAVEQKQEEAKEAAEKRAEREGVPTP